MTFRNDRHEIVGYDVDLAREAARRMGVELVLQPIDWNTKEKELNNGHIDCIWTGFGITEERAKLTLFTPPYLENALILVVKINSLISTLADLDGKTVGTQDGSSSEEALNRLALKASLKDIVIYKDFLGALMDLDAGFVDAVVIDIVVASDNINRTGKSFRILDEHLEDIGFGIGFRLGEKALAGKVWETLEGMARDGTMGRITAQWFGSDISLVWK
jgi:polar amino acid transport system substrate-binding protein